MINIIDKIMSEISKVFITDEEIGAEAFVTSVIHETQNMLQFTSLYTPAEHRKKLCYQSSLETIEECDISQSAESLSINSCRNSSTTTSSCVSEELIPLQSEVSSLPTGASIVDNGAQNSVDSTSSLQTLFSSTDWVPENDKESTQDLLSKYTNDLNTSIESDVLTNVRNSLTSQDSNRRRSPLSHHAAPTSEAIVSPSIALLKYACRNHQFEKTHLQPHPLDSPGGDQTMSLESHTHIVHPSCRPPVLGAPDEVPQLLLESAPVDTMDVPWKGLLDQLGMLQSDVASIEIVHKESFTDIGDPENYALHNNREVKSIDSEFQEKEHLDLKIQDSLSVMEKPIAYGSECLPKLEVNNTLNILLHLLSAKVQSVVDIAVLSEFQTNEQEYISTLHEKELEETQDNVRICQKDDSEFQSTANFWPKFSDNKRITNVQSEHVELLLELTQLVTTTINHLRIITEGSIISNPKPDCPRITLDTKKGLVTVTLLSTGDLFTKETDTFNDFSDINKSFLDFDVLYRKIHSREALDDSLNSCQKITSDPLKKIGDCNRSVSCTKLLSDDLISFDDDSVLVGHYATEEEPPSCPSLLDAPIEETVFEGSTPNCKSQMLGGVKTYSNFNSFTNTIVCERTVGYQRQNDVGEVIQITERCPKIKNQCKSFGLFQSSQSVCKNSTICLHLQGPQTICKSAEDKVLKAGAPSDTDICSSNMSYFSKEYRNKFGKNERTDMDRLGSDSTPDVLNKNSSIYVDCLQEFKNCIRDPSVYLRRCIAINEAKMISTDNDSQKSKNKLFKQLEVKKCVYEERRAENIVKGSVLQGHSLLRRETNKGCSKTLSSNQENVAKSGNFSSPAKIGFLNQDISIQGQLRSISVTSNNSSGPDKGDIRNNSMSNAFINSSRTSTSLSTVKSSDKKDGVVKVLISGEHKSGDPKNTTPKITTNTGKNIEGMNIGTGVSKNMSKFELQHRGRKETKITNCKKGGMKHRKPLAYSVRKESCRYVKNAKSVKSLVSRIQDEVEETSVEAAYGMVPMFSTPGCDENMPGPVTDVVLNILLDAVKEGFQKGVTKAVSKNEPFNSSEYITNVLKNDAHLLDKSPNVNITEMSDNTLDVSTTNYVSGDQKNSVTSSDISSGKSKHPDAIFSSETIFSRKSSTLATYVGSETSSEKVTLSNAKRKVICRKYLACKPNYMPKKVPLRALTKNFPTGQSIITRKNSDKDFDFGDVPVFDIIPDPPTAVSLPYVELRKVSDTSIRSSTSSKPPPHPGTPKKCPDLKESVRKTVQSQQKPVEKLESMGLSVKGTVEKMKSENRSVKDDPKDFQRPTKRPIDITQQTYGLYQCPVPYKHSLATGYSFETSIYRREKVNTEKQFFQNGLKNMSSNFKHRKQEISPKIYRQHKAQHVSSFASKSPKNIGRGNVHYHTDKENSYRKQITSYDPQSYSKTCEHCRRNKAEKLSAEYVGSFLEDIMDIINDSRNRKKYGMKNTAVNKPTKHNIPHQTHKKSGNSFKGLEHRQRTDGNKVVDKNIKGGEIKVQPAKNNRQKSANLKKEQPATPRTAKGFPAEREKATIVTMPMRRGEEVSSPSTARDSGSYSKEEKKKKVPRSWLSQKAHARYIQDTKNRYKDVLQKNTLNRLEDLLIRQRAEEINLRTNVEKSNHRRSCVQRSESCNGRRTFASRNASIETIQETGLKPETSDMEEKSNTTSRSTSSNSGSEFSEFIKEMASHSTITEVDVVEFGGYVFIGVDNTGNSIDSTNDEDILESFNSLHTNRLNRSENSSRQSIGVNKVNLALKRAKPDKVDTEDNDVQYGTFFDKSKAFVKDYCGNSIITPYYHDDVKESPLDIDIPSPNHEKESVTFSQRDETGFKKNITARSLELLESMRSRRIPSVALHTSLTAPNWSPQHNNEFRINDRLLRHLSEGSNLATRRYKRRLNVRDRRSRGGPTKPRAVIRMFLETLLNNLEENPEDNEVSRKMLEEDTSGAGENMKNRTRKTSFDRLGLFSGTDKSDLSDSGGSCINTLPSFSENPSSSAFGSNVSISGADTSDLSLCVMSGNVKVAELSAENILLPKIQDTFVSNTVNSLRNHSPELKTNNDQFSLGFKPSESNKISEVSFGSLSHLHGCVERESLDACHKNTLQIQVSNHANILRISVFADQSSENLSDDVESKNVLLVGLPEKIELHHVANKYVILHAEIVHFSKEMYVKSNWELLSHIGTYGKEILDYGTKLRHTTELLEESPTQQVFSYELPSLPPSITSVELIPTIPCRNEPEEGMPIHNLTTPDTLKDLLAAFSHVSSSKSTLLACSQPTFEELSPNTYPSCDSIEQLLEALSNLNSTAAQEEENFRSDLSYLEDFLERVTTASNSAESEEESCHHGCVRSGIKAKLSNCSRSFDTGIERNESFLQKESNRDGRLVIEVNDIGKSGFYEDLESLSEATSDDASYIALQNQILENYIPDESTSAVLQHILNEILLDVEFDIQGNMIGRRSDVQSLVDVTETLDSVVEVSQDQLKEKSVLLEDFISQMHDALNTNDLLKDISKSVVQLDPQSTQKLMRKMTAELALITEDEMKEYIMEFFGRNEAQRLLNERNRSFSSEIERGESDSVQGNEDMKGLEHFTGVKCKQGAADNLWMTETNSDVFVEASCEVSSSFLQTERHPDNVARKLTSYTKMEKVCFASMKGNSSGIANEMQSTTEENVNKYEANISCSFFSDIAMNSDISNEEMLTGSFQEISTLDEISTEDVFEETTNESSEFDVASVTDNTLGDISDEGVLVLQTVMDSEEQLRAGAGDGSLNSRNVIQLNENQIVWPVISLEDIVRDHRSQLNQQSSSLSVVVTTSVADQSTISSTRAETSNLCPEDDVKCDSSAPLLGMFERRDFADDTGPSTSQDDLEIINEYLKKHSGGKFSTLVKAGGNLRQNLTDTELSIQGRNNTARRRRRRAFATIYFILFSIVIGGLALPTHCE